MRINGFNKLITVTTMSAFQIIVTNRVPLIDREVNLKKKGGNMEG